MPETRSRAHQEAAEEEGKTGVKKHKTESKGGEEENKPKASKANDANDRSNAKPEADIAAKFDEFCKAAKEHLSIDQMRRILDANDQDSSGSDDAVVPKWLVPMVKNI